MVLAYLHKGISLIDVGYYVMLLNLKAVRNKNRIGVL